MSWENHGLKGWHIDHIKPLTNFNLVKIKEQMKAFNFKNTQPMWAYENLRKGKNQVQLISRYKSKNAKRELVKLFNS